LVARAGHIQSAPLRWAGYRHLAYIQLLIGYDVKLDMPQLVGAEVDALYGRGAQWLNTAPTTHPPATRSASRR
jgi:hypothetical protein